MATTTINVTTQAAGNNGEVQFNNGGAFGADSQLSWDNSNKRLTIGGGSSDSQLQVNSISALSTHNVARIGVLRVNGAGDVWSNGAQGNVNNTFFGENSGRLVTGGNNSFFGLNAGRNNTTGINNSLFGRDAGRENTTGINNSFFGENSGRNTIGSNNSFFGRESGRFNTTGVNNSFFGMQAALNNTTGSNNSFFGVFAGFNNTTGGNNSFFGVFAGFNNTTGGNNSFFGLNAGRRISGGGDLTITNNSVFIGRDTRALDNNQTNQIVIGDSAIGAGSNTVTLGNTSIILTILRGTVNMANLPTSSAGLNAGDVWNNGGVLNIV